MFLMIQFFKDLGESESNLCRMMAYNNPSFVIFALVRLETLEFLRRTTTGTLVGITASTERITAHLTMNMMLYVHTYLL